MMKPPKFEVFDLRDTSRRDRVCMAGKTVRAKCGADAIHAAGHIAEGTTPIRCKPLMADFMTVLRGSTDGQAPIAFFHRIPAPKAKTK